MKSFARYVILAPLATALVGPALSGSAFAQSIPPGQSCGGLLCDLGMFGHKVPVNADGAPPTQAQLATAQVEAEASDPHRLPCHDFLCRAFGQRDADAAPPPAPIPVAEAVPEAPAKHARHAKKKHVAEAAPAPAPETK